MGFGYWLIAQAGRDEWIGALAAAASTDPDFPRDGDVDAARLRLIELAAEQSTDPDAFEQLDDAEREWLRRRAT